MMMIPQRSSFTVMNMGFVELVIVKFFFIALSAALWQLLWVNPVPPPIFSKFPDIFAMRKHPVEFLQHKVCVTASELLLHLQDWNNRRQFVSPSHFHDDDVNDYFISQAWYAVLQSWVSKKFMTGCVVLFPLAVTFYITWWFIQFVDGFFSPIYERLGIDVFVGNRDSTISQKHDAPFYFTLNYLMLKSEYWAAVLFLSTISLSLFK